MDLEKLNPIVFGAWKLRKEAGASYYQPSTREQIHKIEQLVEAKLPKDFVEFMLKYSCVSPTPKFNCSSFKCVYNTGPKVEMTWSLVASAGRIIDAVAFYQYPSPYNDEIGQRLPKTLLPLSRDDDASLLIDLRPETYGNILYHPKLTVYTFGSSKNNWDTIGYVAPTFTDMLKELNSEDIIRKRYNL